MDARLRSSSTYLSSWLVDLLLGQVCRDLFLDLGEPLVLELAGMVMKVGLYLVPVHAGEDADLLLHEPFHQEALSQKLRELCLGHIGPGKEIPERGFRSKPLTQPADLCRDLLLRHLRDPETVRLLQQQPAIDDALQGLRLKPPSAPFPPSAALKAIACRSSESVRTSLFTAATT